MSRRLTREAVFKALFQVDVGHIDPGKALQYSLEDLFLTPEERDLASRLFSGIIKHQKELDETITPYLVGWELHRLVAVDRCLLRMALYEILYEEDIPPIVSINEALELAKKYSSSEAVAFINGVLDRISTNRLTEGG